MSQFYQQVFATEVSGPMRKHLALKGFHVLDIDKWTKARYLNTHDCLSRATFDICRQQSTT